MFFWFWQRLFRRGLMPDRPLVKLDGSLETLVRSGPGTWLLTQEKARLDYLAAQEAYNRSGKRSALNLVLERLLRLQATSAVIQSLLNEHELEKLAARSVEEEASSAEPLVGKSR